MTRQEYASRVYDKFVGAGLRPILVGGFAVQLAGYGRTDDVDLMVLVSKFAEIRALFRGDSTVEFGPSRQGEDAWSLRGRLWISTERVEYIEFDILNPSIFAREWSEDDGRAFFTYVNANESTLTRYGKAATVPVVFYMRLLVRGPRAQHYIDKVADDIEAGAPERYLDDALSIARRFGTEHTVRLHVEQVRSLLRSAGPDGYLRKE